MRAPGVNQFFPGTNLSLNRVTGAFAVIWGAEKGEKPNDDPPGYEAARLYNKAYPGKGSVVHAGHLIGKQFGGTGAYNNIVTQEGPEINLSMYKTQFENQISYNLNRAVNGVGGRGHECYVCAYSIPKYGNADDGSALPVPSGSITGIIGQNGPISNRYIPQSLIIGDLYYDAAPWHKSYFFSGPQRLN